MSTSVTPSPSPAPLSAGPVPLPVHHPHLAGYLFMFVSLVCFVVNSLLIRWSGSLPGADTWLAVTCRYVVGLLIVMVVFLPGGRLQLAELARNHTLVLRGLLGGVAIYLFYLTLPILGAGRATVINCGYILFAAMLAGPMLGERLSMLKGAWLAVGCAGIGLLCSRAGTGVGIGWMDFLALLGAVCAAGVVVTIRQLSGTQHFSTIFASQCFFGLILSAIPAGQSHAEPAAITWTVMLMAAVLAAVGQLAMTRAYRDLTVAKGGAVQMLLPVLTALGGVMLFHERYSPIEMAGGVLAIIACWQVLAAQTRKRPSSVTAPEE